MYESSDGTQKNVKAMNTEYIINALAKCYREVYNIDSFKTYEKLMNNIKVLEDEITFRNNEFIDEHINEWSD